MITQKPYYNFTFFYTKIFVCLYLLFAASTAKAQEEFVSPTAKRITKFSFTQLTGGIILIRATLDDKKDSLSFILDTGSGGISLDSTTVEELKLTRTKTDRNIRGIAGMRQVDFSFKHVLKINKFATDSLDFHIIDYEILTSAYGLKIDGIIGFSFLRKYIVQINYDTQTIELFTPGAFKYSRGGFLLKPKFSPLPLETLLVDDDRQIEGRFILDTGAGLCMLFSEDFVKDSSVFKKTRKRYPTQAEGLGGKKLMDITVMKKVRIGPYKFKNVPVHIFEDDYNITSYPQLGGLMGNDLMRRFNMVLNYPEQSIHLKPNNHYLDPFDYSYTGFSIFLIDNNVKIIDIIENSPAAKAGLQSGDIVFGVDNILAKNMQAFKSALQNAGNRVKIFIIRNGQPLIKYLDIKNIKSKR